MQDILYRVHQYFFERDSEIFASMFTLPGPDNPRSEHKQDGSCDDQPIVLPGQESADFDAFLSILYPLCVLVIFCCDILT